MKFRVYFLPGYACTADVWKSCAALMGDQFETISISWPTNQTPRFHSIRQFADWFCGQIDVNPTDTVVGHSLGGLVALEVSRRFMHTGPRSLLVDSFIVPPSPFFQNLLMSDTAPGLADRVTRMLRAEKPHYSETLREQLVAIDMVHDAEQVRPQLCAIYGDRGCGDTAKVIDELNWPARLRERVGISVVENTCHFPMLEDPDRTAQILRSILIE